MNTTKVINIISMYLVGSAIALVIMFNIMDYFKSSEPTELEQFMSETSTLTEVEDMPTASAEMVTAIDPTGKDLTAVTAQINETKIALQVLKGQQAQLQKDIVLRIGQVWTNHVTTDNPFDENPIRHFEITDIKNGYVAYNFILVGKEIGSITDSSDIKTFVSHYAKTLVSE